MGKRIIIIALFCLFGVKTYAFMPIKAGVVAGTSNFSCDGYDICQHFEGTGYDNGETWTWTETLGDSTINEDYATSPHEGSQSLELNDGGADGNVEVSFGPHGDGDTTYIHFTFEVTNDNNDVAAFMELYDGASLVGKMHLEFSGVIKIYHGLGTTDTTTTDFDAGGVYHLWFDWTTANGGSNGVANLYVSATGTKPGSPEAQITDGDSDYPGVDKIVFYATGGVLVWVMDQCLIDNSEIGNVP